MRRQLLCEHLQRPRLARPGRTGYEAVPVRHGEWDAHLRIDHRRPVDHERAELEHRTGEAVPRPYRLHVSVVSTDSFAITPPLGWS